MTWYLAGECNTDLKRYPAALAAYQSALKLEQRFPQAWLGLGKTYTALGRTAEAKEVGQVLAKLDPALAKELAAYQPPPR